MRNIFRVIYKKKKKTKLYYKTNNPYSPFPIENPGGHIFKVNASNRKTNRNEDGLASPEQKSKAEKKQLKYVAYASPYYDDVHSGDSSGE